MVPTKIPSSLSERWNVLDGILLSWFGVESPQGFSDHELGEAGIRLGRPLPASLRQWLARYGKLDEVWQLQESLLPPTRLRVKDDVLTFCAENQWVVRWGIEGFSKSNDDPPVSIAWARTDDWKIESESVSLFAIQFALMNAHWSGATPFRANGETTERIFRAIEQKYPHLPIPDLSWPTQNTRFLGTDELLIYCHGRDWIYVTALTENALDVIDQFVGEMGMNWNIIERSA